MTAVEPAGHRTVRRHNLSLVLSHIEGHDGASRAQIADTTGLTKSTVSTLVDSLTTSGLVRELTPARVGRGRPATPLAINPRGAAGLGLEVNVDYLAACIVDLSGEVVSHRVLASDNRSTSPAVALRRLTKLAARARADAGLPIVGATLAVPGVVDGDGVLRQSPNLPALPSQDLIGLLGTAIDLPVHIDNEANLAALAHLWRTPGSRDFVWVSGEGGVGAGIVLRGELFRGTRGLAGELGHVMVDPRGPVCGCGARGCLEQIAGRDALLGRPDSTTTPTWPATRTVEELAAMASRGDRRTLRHLATVGTALGIALAALVNIVDVPTVVLGGPYSALAEWLIPTLTDELTTRVLSAPWQSIRVRVSPLGGDAAVLGAAMSVTRQLLDDPARSG